MRMLAPHDAFPGIVHIIDPFDPERNILEFLQRHQLTAVVAVRLKNIFDHLH